MTYYVAVNDKGEPLCARSSRRPYSWSNGRGSFRREPTDGFPYRAVAVAKPITWVAKITWADGTVEVQTSKAWPLPAVWSKVKRIYGDGFPDRIETEADARNNDYYAKHPEAFVVLETAPSVNAIKNWPVSAGGAT